MIGRDPGGGVPTAAFYQGRADVRDGGGRVIEDLPLRSDEPDKMEIYGFEGA